MFLCNFIPLQLQNTYEILTVLAKKGKSTLILAYIKPV